MNTICTAKYYLIDFNGAWNWGLPNDQVLAISREFDILNFGWFNCKLMQAFPFTNWLHFIDADYVSLRLHYINHFRSWFLNKCHELLVWREVNASIFVLWRWDILNRLVSKWPYSEAKTAVTNCQDMSVRRCPPTVNHSRQSCINITIPLWFKHITSKSCSSLFNSHQNESWIGCPVKRRNYIIEDKSVYGTQSCSFINLSRKNSLYNVCNNTYIDVKTLGNRYQISIGRVLNHTAWMVNTIREVHFEFKLAGFARL